MPRHPKVCVDADQEVVRKCSVKAFKWAANEIVLCPKCRGNESLLRETTCWGTICNSCVHELGRLIKEEYKPTKESSKVVTALSSAISKFTWDSNTRTLYIQFKQGKVYSYKEVPEGVFIEFYKAPSKGRFFTQLIKGTYEAICLGKVSIPMPSELIVNVREDEEERYLQDYVEGVI